MSGDQELRWHTQCAHAKCSITVCLQCAGFSDESAANKYMKTNKGWKCPMHDREHRHAWYCFQCDGLVTDINCDNAQESIECERCQEWFCAGCAGHKQPLPWNDATKRKWDAFAAGSFTCDACVKQLPKKKRAK